MEAVDLSHGAGTHRRSSSPWSRREALVAFCLLTASRAVTAADSPKAETLLERFVELTGGRPAYRGLHNLYSEGRVESNMEGMSGLLRTWEAEPDLTLTVLALSNGLEFREGTIGGVAWEWSSRGVARLKSGEEKAAALRDGTFNSKVLWRKLFSKVECVGSEEVDGRPAWKVVLTPQLGRPVVSLFDTATGLLLKSVHVIGTPDGDVLSENYYSGYKPVAGVLLPHEFLHKARLEEVRIRLSRVGANVEIPRNRFEPPEEVRKLMSTPAKP
jgi:hypothetical protein